MDGYGGQMIWIDFDERELGYNAIYNNFNWKKIVRDVIRRGKISSEIGTNPDLCDTPTT